jgi:hypothetical protein
MKILYKSGGTCLFYFVIFRNGNAPLTITQEVKQYKDIMKKEVSLEFDQFWRQHSENLPTFTILVHEFCIINSTSVPSESTFSVGGLILGNS